MLWVLLREIFYLLFKLDKSKLRFLKLRIASFNGWIMTLTWVVMAFLLTVTIPHTVELIELYEGGDPANKTIKSVAMALAIELTASLTILNALHNSWMAKRQRVLLLVMTSPFIALTFHFQFSYYAGPREYPIFPVEMAAILPYGVALCAIAIAWIWPSIVKGRAEAKARELAVVTEAQADQKEREELIQNLYNQLRIRDNEIKEAREWATSMENAQIIAKNTGNEWKAKLEEVERTNQRLREELDQSGLLVESERSFPRDKVGSIVGAMFSRVERLNKDQAMQKLEEVWSERS